MRGLKKMLFYLPSFAGGGAERNAVLLAAEFARRGYSVVVAVDRNEGPNSNLLPEAVKVRVLAGGRHLPDILALRRLVKAFQPDVIHAQVGLSPLKIYLAGLGMVSKWRVIIIYDSLYDPNAPLGGRLVYWFAPVLSRASHATVAVSADVCTELVQRFGASKRHVQVIHNPVDIIQIEAKAQEDNLPWLSNLPYILSVGRLIKQKDFPTLIRAFSRIASTINHNLVILGEGPLRQELESLVKELRLADRVYFPGYEQNPFPVYRHASLLVSSSSYEGFGNVLIEAMALGIPVLATLCPGGPKEILGAGKYGLLVEVGDDAGMAEAILATLRNPLSTDNLRARAREFSVEKVANNYFAVATK